MKYQMTVPQIHCSGCVNLIKLSLSEEFENIKVNEAEKSVSFEGKIENIKDKLNKVFSELNELGYKYKNLIRIQD